MPKKILSISNSLTATVAEFSADGAPDTSLPLQITRVIPDPVAAADNPIALIKVRPTSGTAASLPGNVVISASAPALSSLTATLTTALPLRSSQTWLGIGHILGFELIARALAPTAAEILAADPEEGPVDSRALSGTLTLSTFDSGTGLTIIHYSAKFGTDDFGDVSTLKAYTPRDLTLGSASLLPATLTIALTDFALNTEIDLLLICQG